MLPNVVLSYSPWPRKAKKQSKEMHYSGSCAKVMTKRKIVYPSSRQAPGLSCLCIAQFPPDGKLDGKSMKHKAEKHLKPNNKIQTLSQARETLDQKHPASYN